ncbi:BTAD domain-containing putative transcriptional regulator [Oryzobacter terrae]|uniref:nSTAND1 domain-containing NTPase n=1 Tax=Oryzobacter terrae TaxID=1620385 RepID=UPI0036709674
MDYSVLGPLRVESLRGPVEIRGAKERLLLARLVAATGRLVPTTDLVDTLWGDDPPPSAAKSLQTFVLRLRNTLEPDRNGTPSVLLTEGPGYRLAIDPMQVDAERFARLAHLGQRSLAEGRPQSAVDALTDALGLWRGPAYAGFAGSAFADAEGRRLDELRLSATEDRLAAELALGRAGPVVPELERLVGEHPLRERFWEMLVTALYRSGRQGDALGAYDRARAVLDDELGVDPGPGLRSVHARVLAHDPDLGSPSARAALPAGLRPARPLVGRDAELDRMREAWRAAQREGPATVVVRGPQGAGATALVAALAAEVAHDGGVVRLLPGRRGDGAPAPRSRRGSQDHGPRVTASATPVLLVADHVDPDDAGPPTDRRDDGEDVATTGRVPACSPTLTVRIIGPLATVPDGAEVIELSPLSPDDVREVVGGHVPADQVGRVTEAVLARTPGWPGAVHEEAADAARALAVQRVEVAAAVTGSTRAELATARAELADSVAVLRDATGDAEPPDSRTCPWRGLAAYDVEDARWFAGRDRLVAELVSRLAGGRLLALVGASGSGKSSALRAGLLAALAADVLPGSGGWRVVTLRPGPHPMRELARRSLGATGRDEVADLLTHLVTASGEQEGRVLVAVDQFEEVWTVCDDDAERRQFLDTLTELATDPRSSVSVVLAVRSDFTGALADHEALRELVNDGTVLIGPMTPAEVRRAVERPAATAGLVLDDGLADTLVTDAGDEPGLLPLLSTAMAQLWERRDGSALTYGAYVGLGGLSGAIASLAEETYGALSPSRRETARLLLLRLTGPGDGAGVTRRRVPLDEVESLPHNGVREVLEELAAARLVMITDGHVEVAHEALFREWPRLRTWLVEDAAGRAVQRRLAVAASEWDADGREAGALWTGTRLASGLEVLQARPDELTPVEHDFLHAGRSAVDQQQRETADRAAATARQNRRLRRLVVVIGVVLVTAVVAGVLAWRSQQAAESASRSAEAKRLAASALNVEYPDVALLAAVEATRLEQSPETYGALLTLLARQPRVVHRMRVADRFLRIDVSPDGRTVFLGENEPRLRAVDAESGRLLWDREMPERGQVGNITPTPDGAGLIVTELADRPGVVRLDARTGEVDWAVREEAMTRAVPGVMPWVTMGGLTATGAYLVNTDSHVLTLDADTGSVLGGAPWPETMPFTTLFRVWPDGRVSREEPGDTGTGLVFDPHHPDRGTTSMAGVPISFSPDGTRMVLAREVASVSELRIARLADPTRGSGWVRMPAFVSGAPWSPDGSRLAVTTQDGVQLVDTATLALGAAASGHSGAVMDARFAGPSADLVWTAGRDGTAVAFDLSGARTPISTRPSDPEPHIGRSAPVAGLGVYLDRLPEDPNTAHVTDLGTGRNLGELTYDLGAAGDALGRDVLTQVSTVAISPDGSTALLGIEAFVPGPGRREPAGFVVVLDARTRTQRAVVATPWAVFGIAVGRDGRRAVVNGETGYAVVDLVSPGIVGSPTALPEMQSLDMTTGAEVSPDGRLAALARNDEVLLVDVATGRVVRRGPVAEEDDQVVQALAWSGDSATLVAGSDAGWLHVVSAATLEPVAPRRLITGGWVVDLEVSPDGRVLASIGSDGGDTILWDTATWRPYGQPVTDDRLWGWLTFTPDSRGLRILFEEREAVDISVDPADWVAAACAAAGRNLSAEESAVVLPGQPVRPTCPGLD